jgi:hypothetical protein
MGEEEELDRRSLLTVAIVTLGLGMGALAFVLAARSIGPPKIPVANVPAPHGPAMAPRARRPAYLPDPVLTPGVVLPVDAAAICRPGYAQSVRDVPESVKDAVYARYGITTRRPHQYEVDHLISLELGGANTSDPRSPDYLKNLFPEPYDLVVDGRQMGAREKDKAENATRRAVCRGAIRLEDAQAQMARDWTILYRRFIAPEFPRVAP